MERFQVDKPKATRDAGGTQAGSEVVGPYLLLAEIARGDLTSVHLAKKQSSFGFQRLYAIKRLKPALARSTDHVELLREEARLASAIHHANIVGVLDVGADGGAYVVLEYIEGENLETLLARAGADRQARLIVPTLVDALQGLHALHTATDDEGKPLGLVHQAPRARHVLVGVDGTARLIDHSQVRGRDVRASRARSDRLKVAYMAPEQALSPESVDARADVFVMGILLWESLTGEKLFAADTDEQTFQNLLHRRVPRPSEVGAKPPRVFDAICLRALEREPKHRYQSALDMACELRDVALVEVIYATPGEIGHWVRSLVGPELRERRRLSGGEISTNGIAIDVDTPSVGLDVSGLVDERAAAAKVAETSYATGRIFGGSNARIALDDIGDDDKTPALGTRREADSLPAPPPRTLARAPALDPAVLSAPASRSTLLGTGAKPSVSQVAAEVANSVAPASAATSKPSAPKSALGSANGPEQAQSDASKSEPPKRDAARIGLYGAAASLAKPADEKPIDPDQTQPTVFVPSRPGGRRDAKTVSPGAYSKVENPRRSAAPVAFDDQETGKRPSLTPSAAATSLRGSQHPAPTAAEPAPTVRTDASRSIESAPEANAAGKADSTGRFSPVPDEVAKHKRGPSTAWQVAQEVAGSTPAHANDGLHAGPVHGRPVRKAGLAGAATLHEVGPSELSDAVRQAKRNTLPYVAGGATEAPVQHISRRDSTPARWHVPQEPVGTPLRVFSPSDMSPASLAEDSGETIDVGDDMHDVHVVSPVTTAHAMPRRPLPEMFESFQDSLNPPRSYVPPAAPPKRRGALWFASCFLAGTLLVAGAVVLRKLGRVPVVSEQAHVARDVPMPPSLSDAIEAQQRELVPVAPAVVTDAGIAEKAAQEAPAPTAPVAKPAPNGVAAQAGVKMAAPLSARPSSKPSAAGTRPVAPKPAAEVATKATSRPNGLPANPY